MAIFDQIDRPGSATLPALAFAVACLVPSPAAFAQEAAAGNAGNAGAEESEPAAQVEDPDQAAPAEQEPPLEDYEASEQISEDLSVSFPVDI